MRFSEAVVLGSTMFPMKRGEWENCAIGVAARALGCNSVPLNPRQFLAKLYPWLNNCATHPSVPENLRNQTDYMHVIAAVFDSNYGVDSRTFGRPIFDHFIHYIQVLEAAEELKAANPVTLNPPMSIWYKTPVVKLQTSDLPWWSKPAVQPVVEQQQKQEEEELVCA